MKTAPSLGRSCAGSQETITPLILDFLDWLCLERRSYAEVMEAWRTSCPRLPIWEDAVDQGLVARRREDGGSIAYVAVTPLGRQALHEAGRRTLAGT